MKRFFALILTVVILSGVLFVGRPAGQSGATGIFEVSAAGTPKEAAGESDMDTPAYCLYCSRVHSGFTGFFVKIAHRIAWYFCQLFKIERTEGRMRFTEITVDAGAKAPFTLLHISDTHLTLCDGRDDDKKRELAGSRSESFPYALRMLDDAAAKAEELGCMIVHTDSIKAVFSGHMHYDFVSELTPTLKQYIVNVDSGNIVTVQ